MAKKIGVFCPTLNVYGGGEFVAIAIANTLAENNHKVTLFSASNVDPKAIHSFFGQALNPAVETIKQPTRFRPRGLADFYQTIFHSYIASHKSDLFIDAFSNCVYPWTQISYIHYPFLNLHYYSRRFPYLRSPHILQVGALPHVILEKKLVKYNAKLVLANSRYTAEEIEQYQKRKAEVLYPPFSSAISATGKASSKKPQENLIVTTSRLEPNKLLERIPHIAALTDPSIHYAVIGRLYNKETLASLQNLTSKLGLDNRVRFYANCTAEQKIDLLKRAKIYLHTMVGEHFGIAIVEAMALGCLPVAHNSGGMREFVPDQYRYESTQDAADKINSEMQNWSEEKALEAKELSEQFSYSHFSQRFMQLFREHYD